MKLPAILTFLLLLLSPSIAAKVLRMKPAVSWKSLPRDTEMEVYVETLARMMGKPMKIPVVIDPAAEGSCAYASDGGGQPIIGIHRACVGYLRPGGVLNWKAVGILAHEVSHIVAGHIDNDGSHHWEETEADEGSGWLTHKLGGTLEQTLILPLWFRPDATESHPARYVRIESYATGWMRSKAGGPQFPRLSRMQQSWWAELMARRLPWVN